MIIKYINEGSFGSYKGKTPKEDRLEKFKKETGNIIEKSIRDGFLKKVRPYIELKYKQFLYNLENTWYLNDKLRLDFIEDPKKIELELKESNNYSGFIYELIIKLPVMHLVNNNDLLFTAVAAAFRNNIKLKYSLYGVMKECYNYFQYADNVQTCYKEYFSEIYPDEKHNQLFLHTIPVLHLINNEFNDYAIRPVFGIESIKNMQDDFFKWFDNYQIKCHSFVLECERLNFKDCQELSEIFNNHIICDQIVLHRCNGTILESVKGLEKLLSFENLKNKEHNIEIVFINTTQTKPGIDLDDSLKVCSEKLIKDVTGKSYDYNVIEHRVVAVDDPKDMTEEDLIMYQIKRTKIQSLMFNIDRNGKPIKDEYDINVNAFPY